MSWHPYSPAAPHLTPRYDERPRKRLARDDGRPEPYYAQEQDVSTTTSIDVERAAAEEASFEDEESEDEFQDDSGDDYGRPSRKSSSGRKRKNRR